MDADAANPYVHYFVAEPQRLFWSAVDASGNCLPSAKSAKRFYAVATAVLICAILASSLFKATFPCEQSTAAGDDVWSKNTCYSVDKVISYGIIAPVGGFAYIHYKIPEQIVTKAIPEAVRYAVEQFKAFAEWLKVQFTAFVGWLAKAWLFLSAAGRWIFDQVSEPVQVVVDWILWILSIPFRFLRSVLRLIWSVVSAACRFGWFVVSSVVCFVADMAVAAWNSAVVPAGSFVYESLKPVGSVFTLWRSTVNGWLA
jgi:hypothetical protein